MASNPDITARENWARYQHGRDRGHIEYMEQAAKCEGMYMGAGEQWAAADKAILTAQGRPSYEFNEIMPSINSAVGYQIHNRMDIAFKPRGESGDLEKATTLSKVVMQIADQSKLHWRETGVFSDGLIEQRGYYDVRVNFDSNIKGEIEIRTLDPRDVIPDPDAKSYDPKEWSDVIITRWLTLDEIEAMYGRKSRDIAATSGDDDEDFGEVDAEAARNRFGPELGTGRYDAYGNEQDGLERYRIIDRQKSVFESTKCLVFQNSGDVKPEATMTPEQVQAALQEGATYAKRMKRRVRWIVTTYSATLFDDYSPYEEFSIVPYFAYFRRGKTRGMVDNAIGPQEALNKAVSQYIHIINTSANSGWVIEENSLTNMDTDELNEIGARTGLVIEYRKGANQPAKIQPNSVPTGVDKMIQMATQALKEVTVPDAMRGNQGQEISGVAIQSRQFASQQQLAVPLDNLAYTRQLLAIKLVKLVQRYYDSHRVFRITETDPMTGKELDKTVEINKPMPDGSYWNDITIGEYDVVITEQPMQITFENSQFTQALEMRKAGVMIPDPVMIRYSNLTDKHDIAQQMQDRQQPPPDPMAEAKAKLLDAQANETNTRTKLVEAQATETAVKAQYSAIQTAGVIAATPMTSGLADKLLRSAGYVDRDAAPIVPEVPQGIPPQPMPDQMMPDAPQGNTNPMSPPPMPPGPGVGMMDGIETQEADGLVPGDIGMQHGGEHNMQTVQLNLQQRPEGPSYAQQAQQSVVGAVQPYMDWAGPYIDKAVQISEEYPVAGQVAQLVAWPVNAAVAAGGVAQAVNDRDPVAGLQAAVGGIPVVGRFAKSGVNALAGTVKSVRQLQQVRSLGMAPSSDMALTAARRVSGDAGVLVQANDLRQAAQDQTANLINAKKQLASGIN